ncbi:uncharacterized protein K452DRAFT_284551 [Aplosporella prunicola CBS 121167]|uniref:ferric-chelate reductase (NADPH) n=1 Tax=Aplosporella prunicola CBS 121167 TaxID=1176127 RepID=A0A6A6BM92_9PEZI|nr:uncharacterized protein K452DRAFT_284551 [Aplosporella prunicola CBS 121167]KAF2145166.1 hypothetical protein K452DRAFT_284551 [Aplosporella prunicola CBS 121167]
MDGLSDSWLQPAIKHALRASGASSRAPLDDATTISISDEFGANPGKDPRFRKLVEGVLYSRSFLLTYNAVLLVILFGFALAQWSAVLRRAYQRRAAVTRAGKARVLAAIEDGGAASSSSSSTLEGTATPPDAPKTDDVVDERAPLLSGGQRGTKKQYLLVHDLYKIYAWLMYQPRPIPVINKTLPSNGATLVISAFIGLNVFYMFYRTPLSIPMLFVFADRAGILFVANLPVLYLFAAKNQPISWLTGYSYESLNIFHRRLGEVMCLLAFIHGCGMLGVWYTLLHPLGFTFARFVLSRVIFPGIGAFFTYELIYVTSLGSFRQRCYELFLCLHVVLQTAALVLLFLHHSRARIYVGIALGIFLIDRLLFRLLIKSTTLRADLRILKDGETVMLSDNWSIPAPTLLQRLLQHSPAQGWQPGAHVFVTVPALSRRHLVQAHPFTIASAAPSDTASTHAWLSLLIRARDGFTRDLVTHAQTASTARVRLDGPYGSARPLATLRPARLAVLVAGGSGIAVAFPLLWALLNPASADVEALRGGPAAVPRKVCLLWVVRSRAHLDCLPQERLDELREWGADILVPDPTEEKGRPDVSRVVREWVERYAAGDGGHDSTGVVVSGPDGMNRDVRNTCSRLVGEGRRVNVSVEKFGW